MADLGTEAAIADALQRHLFLLVLDPVLPIAWPGTPFIAPTVAEDHPSGRPKKGDPLPYLRANHLPNRTDNLFVGNGASSRHQGLYQITVVFPEGKGIILPSQIACAIVDHFVKGTALRCDGVKISIYEKPSVSPAIQEPGRLIVPVTIRYRSFNR